MCSSDLSKPKRLYFVSIESLVVPAISVTIFLSSPIRALIKDDFPAFGLQTTAKRGNSSFSKSIASGSGILATMASKISPVPLPFIEEIVW